jgi:phosphatidylserine/phosphatidylglycerophosphate/cardiolipin synthase-like enzyme
MRRLADAAGRGALGVSTLRTTATSSVLREACEQLSRRLPSAEPDYLAGLLTGAARAVTRAQHQQSVSVVWTGPPSHVTSSRLTAAVVVELITKARTQLLLVSFATHTEPVIAAALKAAAGRGVEIVLVVERHADNPAYTGASGPFPDLPALRLHWPADQREGGAALHAKVIVVDDKIALVGSANLTGRAMETNLECGILLHGGPYPRAIRAHITDLYATGRLRRL